jgi:hypothetical protein
MVVSAVVYLESNVLDVDVLKLDFKAIHSLF